MTRRIKIRIFVVDDESAIASSLASVLNFYGYETTSYTNPCEALKAACENPPDLLLSDVIMPSMTGIELALQVQRFCDDCKVLLFSEQAATADLLRARANNFDLILKPVHPVDLLKRIQLAFEPVLQ